MFPPEQLHFTPFCHPELVSVMLVARLTKIGILKGVNPSSSGFDEDFADMYNDKIRSVNGRIAEKSEGKFAVFTKGAKIVYSLDVRDALMTVGVESGCDGVVVRRAARDVPEHQDEACGERQNAHSSCCSRIQPCFCLLLRSASNGRDASFCGPSPAPHLNASAVVHAWCARYEF